MRRFGSSWSYTLGMFILAGVLASAGGAFLSLVDAPRGCYYALVIFFTAAALAKSFFPGAGITITIRLVLPPPPPR